MNTELDTSSREFFERMYTVNADPWNFAGDPYETSRYNALIDSLSGRHFGRAFEPGCSVGVLTARLAPFCDELFAIDLSETAVDNARQHCAEHPNVTVRAGSVGDIDPGPLDLLVLSEIGYYFNASQLQDWAGRLASRLRHGGTMLTCHWLGVSPDHLLAGDQVQNILQELARERDYMLTLARRTERYRLECWNAKQI